MIEGLEELDGVDWSDLSPDATRAGYAEALGHARAILDAANVSMITGYWTMRKIPAERDAMIAAISGKMRTGDRRIHAGVVALAVEDAMQGKVRRGLT